MNSGYSGFSMSNRAVEAYESGENFEKICEYADIEYYPDDEDENNSAL